MKKSMLLLILILTSLSGYCLAKASDFGAGFGVGSRLPCGIFGLYMNYTPTRLKNRTEIFIGAGVKNDFAIGGGIKAMLFQLNRFETLMGFDYSYQTAGKIREEKIENHIDYYKVSSNQFVNFYLTERFFFDSNAAVQISCGYGKNISGYSISHIAGPHENDDAVKKYMGSGLMLEFGLVVFFKPMLNN